MLVGACGDSIATRTGKKCDYFRNGKHQETEISVSGGNGLLNYYASGNLLDDQGAEPRSSRQNYSGRLNVAFAPSQKINISANVGYVNGPTNLPCDGGCGGYTWTTMSATPSNYNLANRHGFHSSMPYQYDQTVVLWQDLTRTTASLRFEHSPLPWLSHRLSLGGDSRTKATTNSIRASTRSSRSASGHHRARRRQSLARLFGDARVWNTTPVVPPHDVRRRAVLHREHPLRRRERFRVPDAGPQVGDLDDDTKPTLGRLQRRQVARLLCAGASRLARSVLPHAAPSRSDDHSAFGASFNRVVYPKFSLS